MDPIRAYADRTLNIGPVAVRHRLLGILGPVADKQTVLNVDAIEIFLHEDQPPIHFEVIRTEVLLLPTAEIVVLGKEQ